jgi:hypothetical protein
VIVELNVKDAVFEVCVICNMCFSSILYVSLGCCLE